MRLVHNEILDQGELSFQNVIEILAIINESRWGEVSIEANGTTLKFTRSKAGESYSQDSRDQISAVGRQTEKPTESAETTNSAKTSQAPDKDIVRSASPLPVGEKEHQIDLNGATPVYPPMAGIFYSSSAPGAPKFVEVGDRVKEGQQLGIVEVMKLFTPVISPCAGRVREILVANEAFVENDQIIMLVEEDGK